MKRLALAFLIAIATGYDTFSYAQDSLVGAYTGSYTTPFGAQFGMQLIIASVENGLVKGTVTVYRGPCSGSYPMEGNYGGNKLAMKSTAKGSGTAAGDCGFGFDVAQEGNKFVGKTGLGWPLQFSK